MPRFIQIGLKMTKLWPFWCFAQGFRPIFLAKFCQKLAENFAYAIFLFIIHKEGTYSSKTWKFESNRIKDEDSVAICVCFFFWLSGTMTQELMAPNTLLAGA